MMVCLVCHRQMMVCLVRHRQMLYLFRLQLYLLMAVRLSRVELLRLHLGLLVVLLTLVLKFRQAWSCQVLSFVWSVLQPVLRLDLLIECL